MKKYSDFELLDQPEQIDDCYQIAPAQFELEDGDLEEIQMAENLGYSSRSRIARIGIETGILPYNSTSERNEFMFMKGLYGDFEHFDLKTDGDKVKTMVVIRNNNKVVGEAGPEINWKEGDKIGRLFSFNNEDVAINREKEEEVVQLHQEFERRNPEKGPNSYLRFYTEGDHPDLNELVEEHNYEHDQARILLPITHYAKTSVEGKITVSELEEFELEEILKSEDEIPDKVTSGVYYTFTDPYKPIEGMNLWLTDPNNIAFHLSSKLIDDDFEGDKVAFEFVYFPTTNRSIEVEYDLPQKIGAFAIK